MKLINGFCLNLRLVMTISHTRWRFAGNTSQTAFIPIKTSFTILNLLRRHFGEEQEFPDLPPFSCQSHFLSHPITKLFPSPRVHGQILGCTSTCPYFWTSVEMEWTFFNNSFVPTSKHILLIDSSIFLMGDASNSIAQTASTQLAH